MARRLRIHLENALYYVMLRGNAGASIFRDDADRRAFIDLLEAATQRFGCRVHAFALLPSSIHLAIQVGTQPISRIMHFLGFRYTLAYNRSARRAGHVFQGRFRSQLVDPEWLVELVRAIHLSPVRARAARGAHVFRWSSQRAYMGQVRYDWLTTADTLGRLHSSAAIARRRIAELTRDSKQISELESSLLSPRRRRVAPVVGGDAFRASVGEQGTSARQNTPPVSLPVLLERASAFWGVDLKQLRSPSRVSALAEKRALLALAVRETPGLQMRDLGEALGRDGSTLSTVASHIEERMRSEPQLLNRYAEVQRLIYGPPASELN